MAPSSLLGVIATLLVAAVLFQLLWRQALAAVVWGPPAYVGIVVGWSIFQWSASAEASIAIAVAANMIVRLLVARMVGTALSAVTLYRTLL